jgi:hypothetical protein
MRYYKVEDGIPKEYSIEQLLKDHIGANICDPFIGEISEKLLLNYNVYKLIECPPLDIDNCIEGEPIFENNQVNQTWIDLSEKINNI